MTTYTPKRIRFQNGERHSVLIAPTGLPVHEATLFLLRFRTRGRAANTIHLVCTALAIFHSELDSAGIDIRERLRHAKFLTATEIDRISRAAQSPAKDLESEKDPKRGAKVISLERVHPKLKRKKNETTQVDIKTRATRLWYINQYLEFLTAYYQSTLTPRLAKELDESSKNILKLLLSGIPRVPRRAKLDARTGLSHEEENRLLKITHPDSSDNPWRHNFVRQRNWVIIVMLLATGMRRGELLGLRISDISSNEPKLVILRRPDDLEDPRRIEPNTKTGERRIEISRQVMQCLNNYINEYRRSIKASRKHQYVFVANDGQPLSLTSIDKIFQEIRKSNPNLPRNLTSHVMRHTWNDRFSEQSDILGLTPEVEQKARNEHQGWSENSMMGVTYTRRTTSQKGREVALKLQETLDASLKRDR